MSTHCNIAFSDGTQVVANLYKHHDGYPASGTGVLALLEDFFQSVWIENASSPSEEFKGFGHAGPLAAVFVVWHRERTGSSFLRPGLSVTRSDSTHVDYSYMVNCGELTSDGFPSVSLSEDPSSVAPPKPRKFRVSASFVLSFVPDLPDGGISAETVAAYIKEEFDITTLDIKSCPLEG